MKKFVLKFLWLNRSIAVALDQVVGEKIIPLTPYFIWPSRDAWEDMRVYFDSNNWISDTESVFLLNKITEVINYWQDQNLTEKINIEKVRESFPDIYFIGYN